MIPITIAIVYIVVGIIAGIAVLAGIIVLIVYGCNKEEWDAAVAKNAAAAAKQRKENAHAAQASSLD